VTTVSLRTVDGGTGGDVDLDDAWFGATPHMAVMHQVVTAQLAAARSGTQSTKTRAEVRGGGSKPWRQKGTGRARQGSIRAPHWRGGGVSHAPKPRSYKQRTPKKMVRLALVSALSDRAADNRVVVIDRWTFDAPSTKSAVAALAALDLTGKVVVVLGDEDATVAKSFRNLTDVHVLARRELNAYDILCSDWVVFTQATLPGAAGAPSIQPTATAPADPVDEEPEPEPVAEAEPTPETEEEA
jgi:large subunit ribosomal protein L4